MAGRIGDMFWWFFGWLDPQISGIGSPRSDWDDIFAEIEVDAVDAVDDAPPLGQRAELLLMGATGRVGMARGTSQPFPFFFALKPPVQSRIKYHTLIIYIYTCIHYDIYISIVICIYIYICVCVCVCVWYIDVYCGITFICVLRHGCHTLWIVEVTSSFGSPRLVICQLDVLLQHLRRAANVCCMLMYVLVYSTNRQVWLFCFKVVWSLLSSLFSCPYLATCLDWCR